MKKFDNQIIANENKRAIIKGIIRLAHINNIYMKIINNIITIEKFNNELSSFLNIIIWINNLIYHILPFLLLKVKIFKLD